MYCPLDKMSAFLWLEMKKIRCTKKFLFSSVFYSILSLYIIREFVRLMS